MSLWERLKSKLRDATEAATQDDEENARERSQSQEPASARGAGPQSQRASARDREASRPEARLARFGEPAGPAESEVLDALRRARGGPDETRTLSAVLTAGDRLTDSIRVACAVVLVTRGEEERALDVLAPCRSAEALMLAADLFAGRGETARALGSIERVLAKDLAAPGAMERHARWSQQLGANLRPAKRLDEATIVAATPADTPFRIEREVARGGAGAVYEAYDELLSRKIAFKAYHGGADDRGAVEREVRFATRFVGVGVIRVLDASPDAGWVALEWASQGSLRDWIRARRVDDLFPVMRWAMPLAKALARVHSAGFVHADVKPTNILLNGPSAPLLSDFGIARKAGAPAVGGSAGYVSPERLAGAPTSFSDDVYGFGRTVDDVLSACPDHARSQGGLALERLVTLCLEPVPKRPADARQLVDLLAALGTRV